MVGPRLQVAGTRVEPIHFILVPGQAFEKDDSSQTGAGFFVFAVAAVDN
jgi:hypothetical protein